MSRDEIFKENTPIIADFDFGKKVALVFDDMLERSVPFYREVQRLIVEMAMDFAVEGTNIYDLGCSTGTTLINLSQNIPSKVKFIGVDYSQDMLDRCRQKLDAHHFSMEHELICADLNQGVNIENASVVVMVLTLQFIRPLRRDKLIGSILKGLNENGCLILFGVGIASNSLPFVLLGIPFFLFAYMAIMRAEENFLGIKFGQEFKDYCKRVNRIMPNFSGIGNTIEGMEFNWKRLLIKEYGTPFAWITGLIFLIFKDTFLDYGYEASKNTLWSLIILFLVVTCAYLTAWYLKKIKLMRSD